MYKSFNVISRNLSRVKQLEGVPRQAASNVGQQVRTESRWSKIASRTMTALVQAYPLVRPGMPNRTDQFISPLNLERLGGVRTFSANLPPASLIDRYKPVLEEAISYHDELVEMVENDNYCIASFVETALNLAPGAQSIQLDNGHSIIGIDETVSFKESSARIYELRVMPPERAGCERRPFSLQVTVYKADIFKQPRPADLKIMLGLCSMAVESHRGKLPRKLYSSISVFSSTFKELGGLYQCADSVKSLIWHGHLSKPTELPGVIRNQMKLRHIDLKSKFAEPLKSILIEEFTKKYPGSIPEVQRVLEKERAPKPALFQHEIGHRGGAVRAAMRLNTLAMRDPEAGFSATCVTPSAESGEQRFTILYHPSNVWLEQKYDPENEPLESSFFAKPAQLSEALKQRGVESIISPMLGML